MFVGFIVTLALVVRAAVVALHAVLLVEIGTLRGTHANCAVPVGGIAVDH